MITNPIAWQIAVIILLIASLILTLFLIGEKKKRKQLVDLFPNVGAWHEELLSGYYSPDLSSFLNMFRTKVFYLEFIFGRHMYPHDEILQLDPFDIADSLDSLSEGTRERLVQLLLREKGADLVAIVDNLRTDFLKNPSYANISEKLILESLYERLPEEREQGSTKLTWECLAARRDILRRWNKKFREEGVLNVLPNVEWEISSLLETYSSAKVQEEVS